MDSDSTLVMLNAVFKIYNTKNEFTGKDSLFNLQIRKDTWEDIKVYREEYKYVIKQRETNRLPFVHRSPQFFYRGHIINYLKDYATNKQLTHCTLHLTVYLLDMFMDNHSIKTERILLVTNVCLLLAAKLEENNLTIPKIKEVNATINNKFEIKDYKAMEILILQFFDYSIMFPTAAHYTHYYLQGALCREELEFQGKCPRITIREMHRVMRRYLDKIIEDVHYMQCYKPSLLASAVIAIARNEVGLTWWSNQLSNLTNYTEDDIEETRSALIGSIPLYCKNCINIKNNI